MTRPLTRTETAALLVAACLFVATLVALALPQT